MVWNAMIHFTFSSESTFDSVVSCSIGILPAFLLKLEIRCKLNLCEARGDITIQCFT